MGRGKERSRKQNRVEQTALQQIKREVGPHIFTFAAIAAFLLVLKFIIPIYQLSHLDIGTPDQRIDAQVLLLDPITQEETPLLDEGMHDSVVIRPESIAIKSIQFNDVNAATLKLLRVAELDDEGMWVQSFAIDPLEVDFTSAIVTVKARGTRLFKCTDWNFTTQTCYGSWTLTKSDLVPGVEYNFTLTPEDPGFGEVINITNADHLDENRTFISNIFEEVRTLDGVWSEPIYNNEWVRVTFEKNLTSGNDITIYTRNNHTRNNSNNISSNTYIEVYHFNTFTKITEFPPLLDEGYTKVLLTGMEGVHDTFDLRIVNRENDTAFLEFDHIVDPSGTGGGLMIYGDTATATTPTWRTWNPSHTLGSTSTITPGMNAYPYYITMEANPNNGSEIVVLMFSAGTATQDQVELKGFIFDNVSNSFDSGTSFTTTAPSKSGGGAGKIQLSGDIGVEGLSGDALVVYTDNTDVLYRTRSGGAWSGATALATGNISWALDVSCDKNSDNCIAIWADNGDTANVPVRAAVWDGTSWETVTLMDSASIFSIGLKELAMPVGGAWEGTSGDGVALWIDNSGNIRYNTYTSGSWGTSATVTQFTAVATAGGKPSGVVIKGDHNSNNVAAIVADGDGKDAEVAMWSGTSWGTATQICDGTVLQCDGSKNTGDILWRNDSVAYAFWSDKSDAGLRYAKWDTSWGTSTDLGAIVYSGAGVDGDAFHDGDSMFIFADDGNTNLQYGYHTQSGGTFSSETAISVTSTTGKPRAFAIAYFDGRNEAEGDTTPPATVTNLGESEVAITWIPWNWTNPADADFDHVEVWLDDIWQVNLTTEAVNMTNLTFSTTYEIGIRTVDTTGNINTTWVNDTATTSPEITPPVIQSVSSTPDPINPGNTTSSSANVTDNEVIDSVWVIYDMGTPANTSDDVQDDLSFNATSGLWEGSYILSPTATAGLWIATYNANDTSGNNATTVQTNFTVGTYQITIVNPKEGETYNTLALTLDVDVSQYAVTCRYSLNGGLNTTFTCNATTNITASEGSNSLITYVNNSNDGMSNDSVTFIVNTSNVLSISITDPANGTSTHDGTPLLTLLAIDKVYSSIDYTLYTYFGNGTLFSVSNNGTLTNNTPSQIALSPSLNLIGNSTTYYIIAVANDSAPNYDNSTALYVTISTPVVSLLSPVPSYIDTDGDINFTFKYDDASDLTANCSLYLDGVLNQSNASTDRDVSTTFIVTNIPEGVSLEWKTNCTVTSASAAASRTFRVDTSAPAVSALIPASDTAFNTSDTIEIGANVTDNHNVDVVLANITLPNATIVQITLNSAGGEKYNDSYTIPALVGTYTVTFIANDTAGNMNATETTNFTALDPNPPTIHSGNNTPDPIDPGTSLFSASNVSDDGSVNASWVIYDLGTPGTPGDDIRVDFTYNATSAQWEGSYLLLSSAAAGVWIATFYANDSSGNNATQIVTNFTVNTVVSISLSSTPVNFIAVEAGKTSNASGSQGYPLYVTNAGNVDVNVSMSGTTLLGQIYPSYTIGASNVTWDTNSSFPTNSTLSGTAALVVSNLSTTDNQSIYFRLYAPLGIISQTYRGNVSFSAVQS